MLKLIMILAYSPGCNRITTATDHSLFWSSTWAALTHLAYGEYQLKNFAKHSNEHMQTIYTLLQADNHINTPALTYYSLVPGTAAAGRRRRR